MKILLTACALGIMMIAGCTDDECMGVAGCPEVDYTERVETVMVCYGFCTEGEARDIRLFHQDGSPMDFVDPIDSGECVEVDLTRIESPSPDGWVGGDMFHFQWGYVVADSVDRKREISRRLLDKKLFLQCD